MRVVRLADRPTERWSNGGGDTRELASHRDGDDVLWRISVATIEGDCAFSRFDGIDRSLFRLDGGSLALTIAGRSIAVRDNIVAFPGDACVTAAIDTAPMRVLNVMTRRSAATHRVTIGPCRSAVRPALDFAMLLAPYSCRSMQFETGDLLAIRTPFDMPPAMTFALVQIIM